MPASLIEETDHEVHVAVDLAILMAASACGSARGATMDTTTVSTFAYSSMQQVKPGMVTMRDGPNDQNVTRIRATCTNADDLPLAGGCSHAGPGADNATATVNSTLSWEGKFPGPAGSACAWSGQAVHVPNAQLVGSGRELCGEITMLRREEAVMRRRIGSAARRPCA